MPEFCAFIRKQRRALTEIWKHAMCKMTLCIVWTPCLNNSQPPRKDGIINASSCDYIYLTIMKARPQPLLSELHLTRNLPTSPSLGSQRALCLLHTQLYLLLIWLRPTLQIKIILDEKRRDFDGKCVDDKLITVCYVKDIIRPILNNGIINKKNN